MATEKATSPVEQELTGHTSFSDTVGSMPNPDVILRKSGISTDVYEEMLYDPQIFSAYQKRKRKVQQLKYSIEGGEDGVVEFVSTVLSAINMSNLVTGMIKALAHGYSIAEIIWEQVDGKWVVSDIKNRSNKKFEFSEQSELMFDTGINGMEIAPYGKFLIHRNDYDDVGNPYGTSLNSRCYWYWRFKKHGWRVWGLYLEKYGDPALALKSPETDVEKITKLLESLDNVSSGSNIVIGADEELDTVTASSSSSIGYGDYVKEADKQISKIYLGSSMLMDESGSGSYATAVEHGSDLDDIVMTDAEAIATSIRLSIIEPLVFYNFGTDVAVPFMKFFKNDIVDNETQTDVNDVLEDDNTDVDTDVDVEEETKAQIKAELREEFSSFFFNELSVEQFANLPLHKQTIENLSHNLGKSHKGVFKTSLSFKGYSDKAEYAQLEMSNFYNKLTDDLSVNIGYSLFFIKMYAKMATPSYRLKFEIDNYATTIIEQGVILPYEEARKIFQSKVPISDSLFRDMVAQAKMDSFSIANQKSTSILTQIQNSLSQAINDGTGESEWKVIGDRLLRSLGVTPISKAHMANVYRTNLYSAYSKAGYEQYKKVEKAFPALMYDAIGDNRTRPAHLALDGKIFYSDDDIWNTIYPPNGYNCRCSVIPISKKRLANATVSNGKDYRGSEYQPDDGWGYHGGNGHRPIMSPDNIQQYKDMQNWKDYGLDRRLKPIDYDDLVHSKNKNKSIPSDSEITTATGDKILLPKGKQVLTEAQIKKALQNPNEVWQKGGLTKKGLPSSEKTYISSIKDKDGNVVQYGLKVNKNGEIYDISKVSNNERQGVAVYPESIYNKKPFSEVIDDYEYPLDEFTSDGSWGIRDKYYGVEVDEEFEYLADEMEKMFKESAGDNNGRTLYRGLRFDDEASRDSVMKSIEDTGFMRDVAPASTSVSEKIGIKFAGTKIKGLVLEIDGVSTSGYDISKFGVKEELEVVLKPNTTLKYIETIEEDDFYRLRLREEH